MHRKNKSNDPETSSELFFLFVVESGRMLILNHSESK